MNPSPQTSTGHLLSDLLRGMVTLDAEHDRPVTALVLDSREVAPGKVFIALNGEHQDAREFIPTAIAEGAVAVLAEADQVHVSLHDGVPVIGVPDLRRRTGNIADRFYAQPSRAMTVIGVTGTNGKTTVSHFIGQALERAEAGSTGIIGTLGNGPIGALKPAQHTTPDPISLQAELASQRARGIRNVAMEVSSHGLEQGRVAGVAFDMAVFTNLTREHLDYHPDMAAYGSAKRRLFHVPGLRTAVLNRDDGFSAILEEDLEADVRVLGYGMSPDSAGCDVHGSNLQALADGLALDVQTTDQRGQIRTRLLGRFNAANLLAAISALLGMGMDLSLALSLLSDVRNVPGRMEVVADRDGRPRVVVDYAHTPDALEQALNALRPHCAGRLWCVFGCGGERDAGKRPDMGRVAETLADRIILTDDNPRFEDPAAIIEGIRAGLKRPASVPVQHDRALAIRQAWQGAGADDLVLIAGKGHEDFQSIAGQRLPFSDRQVVEKLMTGPAS